MLDSDPARASPDTAANTAASHQPVLTTPLNEGLSSGGMISVFRLGIIFQTIQDSLSELNHHRTHLTIDTDKLNELLLQYRELSVDRHTNQYLRTIACTTAVALARGPALFALNRNTSGFEERRTLYNNLKEAFEISQEEVVAVLFARLKEAPTLQAIEYLTWLKDEKDHALVTIAELQSLPEFPVWIDQTVDAFTNRWMLYAAPAYMAALYSCSPKYINPTSGELTGEAIDALLVLSTAAILRAVDGKDLLDNRELNGIILTGSHLSTMYELGRNTYPLPARYFFSACTMEVRSSEAADLLLDVANVYSSFADSTDSMKKFLPILPTLYGHLIDGLTKRSITPKACGIDDLAYLCKHSSATELRELFLRTPQRRAHLVNSLAMGVGDSLRGVGTSLKDPYHAATEINKIAIVLHPESSTPLRATALEVHASAAEVALQRGSYIEAIIHRLIGRLIPVAWLWPAGLSSGSPNKEGIGSTPIP